MKTFRHVLIGTLLLCTSVLASETTLPLSHFKYGTGGCGLGSLLFQGDPSRAKQWLAATINSLTFPVQWVSIIGGYLNCLTIPPPHFIDPKLDLIQDIRLPYKVGEGVRPEHIPKEMRFGSGGCGPGAHLLGRGEGFNQVFVFSTNQTSFQGFSITTGTSGCASPGELRRRYGALQMDREHWEDFVALHEVRLFKELARGQGEGLDSYFEGHSCAKTAMLGWFIQMKDPSGWRSEIESLILGVERECSQSLLSVRNDLKSF